MRWHPILSDHTCSSWRLEVKDTGMEDDAESQENELLALNGIFEDEDTFIGHEDNSGGSFYASVQLPEDCAVKLTGQMVQQARALG